MVYYSKTDAEVDCIRKSMEKNVSRNTEYWKTNVYNVI